MPERRDRHGFALPRSSRCFGTLFRARRVRRAGQADLRGDHLVLALLVSHFDLIARLQAAPFCDNLVVGNEIELLAPGVCDQSTGVFVVPDRSLAIAGPLRSTAPSGPR